MKFYLPLFCFFALPIIACAQEITAPVTLPSNQDNGFSIGIYGGPNNTWVKNMWDNQVGVSNSLICVAGRGYDYSLITKLKLNGGIFFSTGLSYEIQDYKMNTNNFAIPSVPIYFPNNQIINFPLNLTYTIQNYYVSIPLMAGYAITRNKWEFYTGLGIEFYYNMENKETVILYDAPIEQRQEFVGLNGHIVNSYSPYYFPWSAWGAFGILNVGVNYKITPKLSISCMPVVIFTDPFANIPYKETFANNAIQGTLSLNAGLIYNFSNKDTPGAFLRKDSKLKRIAFGFNIIPTYLTNKIIFPTGSYFTVTKTNAHYTYSYAFTVQYDLTEQVKLESGIAIDNFDYLGITTNTLIGLPIVVKYYFPLNDAQTNSLYIGAGCHFDYPTNIGWLYFPTHSFILPLALFKCGYQANFGTNYFFDASIGFEHSFQNIQSSSGTINPDVAGAAGIQGLPNYIFSTIGFGYNF